LVERSPLNLKHKEIQIGIKPLYDLLVISIRKQELVGYGFCFCFT
jgi:hypothetical protein